jgi:tetratricopeptide (TPR) repeat protein
MKSIRRHAALAALSVLLVAFPVSAQEAHPAGHARDKTPALGTIVFPNSANAAAQEPFLRGVALLHSFEYSDAAEAFRQVQAVDPGFAIGYWVEALTYSHVAWRVENLPASRAALQRLAATPAERLAKARTPRERQFGAAVEALYVEGALAARVRAYADSMRQYARAWPRDVEAAAFASHAIMLAAGVAPSREERDSLHREAIALSQGVLKAQPSHPGATHYLIHLYDSPGMAAQGLEFARAYDKIAPDAEHALHMPSHIYLQLGMWSDVVASNERAWPASRAAGAPSFHTLSWLQYGYLEQRRWADALALIDSARAIVPTLRGYEADWHFIIPRLEFQYAAATGKWSHPLTQPPAPSSSDMSDREASFRRFANYWSAVDAAMRNDSAALARFAAPFVARADSPLAAGGSRQSAASLVALSNALLVHALVVKSHGDREGYMQSLRVAAEQEKQLEAFIGPPERLFASELLGAELIAQGRAAEAVGYFETVLRLCPGRSEALLGLARARSAAKAAMLPRQEASVPHRQVSWKRDRS